MQKAEPQHGHTHDTPAQRRSSAPEASSPEGDGIARLAAMMDSSPRQAAQRRQFDRLFGPAQRAQENNGDGVVQRKPEEWATAPQIARMLGHPHGWFSTWKKIKADIGEYIGLGRWDLDARTGALDRIDALIVEWEADPKHAVDSTEERVRNIRTDLPLLRNLIDRERREIAEDRHVADFFSTGAYPNVAIPPELSANIAGLATNAEKAAQLFQNINNFRFRYEGMYIEPRVALAARQGDCQTLVGLFQVVAAAYGIPFTLGSERNRLLVDPRPIHGRGAQGNTEGATHWYFREHFWAISGGTAYDLLYMTSPPPNYTVSNGSVAYRGVTYYTFPGGHCVIEPDDGLPIEGEGRVFANAAAAQAFIDHPG